MSVRVSGWFAWSLWALSTALVVAGVLLLYLNGTVSDLLDQSVGVDAAVGLAFPAIGAFVASRRPDNAVGWIFCAIGLSQGAASFTFEYGRYTLLTEPGSLPAGLVLAWIGTWVWIPGTGLTATLLLLLFPDGRLLSQRWRPIAWISVVGITLGVTVMAVLPWSVTQPSLHTANPLGVQLPREALNVIVVVLLGLLGTAGPLSVISLTLRFYRSRGDERQQLKWFVFAGVLYILVLFLPLPGITLLQIIASPMLPIAAAFAILKYRLYDIDVVINRTLVYTLLTASLAFIYLLNVVLLQRIIGALSGGSSQLAIVASTLVIAALFNPLRQRIQSFIDRRFYRRKYDAAKTLEAFGVRLRDETDVETLTDDMVSVVRETLQPEHVSLWLRPSAGSGETSGEWNR